MLRKMVHHPVNPTSTQKVTARLQSEGWVDCVGLNFAALSQSPMSDIQTFILAQLHHGGGWLWLVDLQMAALIFSVPLHQFEIHPHFQSALKQLQTEGIIRLIEQDRGSPSPQKSTVAVVLTQWLAS